VRFPATLFVIMLAITVLSNLGTIRTLGSDAPLQEKAWMVVKMVAGTPHRLARDTWDSWSYYEETGSSPAVGLAVLYVAALFCIFLFLHDFMSWLIGFFRPMASEERQTFAAFLLALGLLALAIFAPVDPATVLLTALIIAVAVILVTRGRRGGKQWSEPDR